jgi:hypothetical protein
VIAGILSGASLSIWGIGRMVHHAEMKWVPPLKVRLLLVAKGGVGWLAECRLLIGFQYKAAN